MPYALVDTYDGSDLSGTTIRFQGKILEIGQDIFPPELQYFGFSTLAEAKAVQREHNNAGLYQLCLFHFIPASLKVKVSGYRTV